MSKATTQVMNTLKVSENNLIISINQIPAHFSSIILFLASATSKTGDNLSIHFCGEIKEKIEVLSYVAHFFLIPFTCPSKGWRKISSVM